MRDTKNRGCCFTRGRTYTHTDIMRIPPSDEIIPSPPRTPLAEIHTPPTPFANSYDNPQPINYDGSYNDDKYHKLHESSEHEGVTIV